MRTVFNHERQKSQTQEQNRSKFQKPLPGIPRQLAGSETGELKRNTKTGKKNLPGLPHTKLYGRSSAIFLPSWRRRVREKSEPCDHGRTTTPSALAFGSAGMISTGPGEPTPDGECRGAEA